MALNIPETLLPSQFFFFFYLFCITVLQLINTPSLGAPCISRCVLRINCSDLFFLIDVLSFVGCLAWYVNYSLPAWCLGCLLTSHPLPECFRHMSITILVHIPLPLCTPCNCFIDSQWHTNRREKNDKALLLTKRLIFEEKCTWISLRNKQPERSDFSLLELLSTVLIQISKFLKLLI